MNHYNIKTKQISSDEFYRCCRKGFEQIKIAYLAADEPYADEEFEYALKKVVKEEDTTFIRAEISAENHQQTKFLIDFFIRCVSGKLAYGIADIGPFREITMYISY